MEHTPEDPSWKFQYLGGFNPGTYRRPYMCFSPDSSLLISVHTGGDPGTKFVYIFNTDNFSKNKAFVATDTMDLISSHMFVHEDKKGDCFEGEFDLVTPQGIVLGLWGERLDATVFRCHYVDLRNLKTRLQSSDADIDLKVYQLKPTIQGCEGPNYELEGHKRYFFSLLRGNQMGIISGAPGEANWRIRLFIFRIDFKALDQAPKIPSGPPAEGQEATVPSLNCTLIMTYDTGIEGTDFSELSDLYSKVSPGDIEFYLYDNDQSCLKMFAILQHYEQGYGTGYSEPKICTVFEGEMKTSYSSLCVRGDNRYAIINRDGAVVELYFRTSYEHPYKLFHSIPLRNGNSGLAELSTDMKYLMISKSIQSDIEVYPLHLPTEGAKLLMPIYRQPKTSHRQYRVPGWDAMFVFVNGELHWTTLDPEMYASSTGAKILNPLKEQGVHTYCTGVIADPLEPETDTFLACLQTDKVVNKVRTTKHTLYRGSVSAADCSEFGADLLALLDPQFPNIYLVGEAVCALKPYSFEGQVLWIKESKLDKCVWTSDADKEERLDWEVMWASKKVIIARAQEEFERVTIIETGGGKYHFKLDQHVSVYSINHEHQILIIYETGTNAAKTTRNLRFVNWRSACEPRMLSFDRDFVFETSNDGKFVLISEDKLQRLSIVRVGAEIDRYKISQDIRTMDTFGISYDSSLFWYRDGNIKNKFTIKIWSTEDIKPLHQIDLFQYPNYEVSICLSQRGLIAWGGLEAKFDCVRSVSFLPSKKMLLHLANLFLESYNSSEPDSDEQKKALSNISICSQIIPKWMIPNYHITTTLTYLLNDEPTFREWLEFIGHDVIFNAHNLLELFFSNFQAKSTAQLTFLEYFNFKDKYGDYPKIDGRKFNEILLNNPDLLIRDELRRKITSSLLVINVGKTILLELGDSDISTAVLPIEEDPFRRKNIHHCIQTVIPKLSSTPPAKSSEKQQQEGAESANNQSYQPHRSLVKLDLSNGSQQCMALISVLEKMSDSELKSRLRPLVYYKWYKIYWYVLCYCLVYWSACIIGYIYYSNPTEQSQLAGPLLGLCGALVLFELKCLWSQGAAKYFGQVWNWTDLFILGFNLAVIIFLMVLPSEHSFSVFAINWHQVFALSSLWVRGTTWLRVFKSTRYLITMVLQVFLDFIPFLAVFASVIFLFAFLWRMSAGLGELEPSEPLGFYESLYDSVMIIFGNSPDQETIASVVRFIIIVIGNIVLALVFANFLIAIISGTFERINEEKDLYDIKELLSMIQDFDSFLSPVIRSKQADPLEEKGEYFLTLLAAEDETNEHTAQLEALGGEVKNLAAQMAVVAQRLDKMETSANKHQKGLHELLEANNARQTTLIETITQIETKLHQLKQ